MLDPSHKCIKLGKKLNAQTINGFRGIHPGVVLCGLKSGIINHKNDLKLLTNASYMQISIKSILSNFVN